MPNYRIHRIDIPSDHPHYRAFWQNNGQFACVESWTNAQWSALSSPDRPRDVFPTPRGWMRFSLVEGAGSAIDSPALQPHSAIEPISRLVCPESRSEVR
jgi:hypothetical protein